MILTIGANPIFLTKNYVNRDVVLAGGVLTASSMQALAERVVDMDPYATWNSGGSNDTVTETLDIALYEGITQTLRSDIALIALLNINFKSFTIQLSDDNGSSFHTTYTVANHAAAQYVLDLSSGLKSANFIRVTATTTQTANEEKMLGTVVVAGLLRQMTADPVHPMTRANTANVKAITMADGSQDITYIKRSAASYEFFGMKLKFEYVTDAELLDLRALRGVGRFGIMHNKLGIYDGRLVSAGSFNWAVTANEANSENAVFLRDPHAVDGYREYFDWMWGFARPLADGPGEPVKDYGPPPEDGTRPVQFNGMLLPAYSFSPGGRTEANITAAVNFYSRAVAVIEQQRASIHTESSKIGFVGDKQALYAGLVRVLYREGQYERAFETVERAKSRALVDLLAERQNFAVQAQGQDNPAESLKLLASLEQKSGAYTVNSDESSKLRSAISGARADLTRSAPELASLVTVSAPRAADIQTQLGADESLLEYYGQGDDLYAFTVTRAAITAKKLDGKGLETEVRTFRETLGNVGTEAWKPLAQKLYARLVAPVQGALAKPRLIIVSHGALHYLPWSALHDGQRFLSDRAALTFLPSASVLQFLASRRPATARDMLILGNPDLGDKALDLPGAEAEARAIKAIWPNSTMLMRKAASKGALTKAGQLFRVIHVAAHGEFDSAQPLASRLLLSPEGADNGQLTAGDLYGLRLNADLVTLSACETGMGKVLNGDDVVGLTRGFLYAGANSIVASLWPVSDDETKFLMTSFYGNLRKMPKADALRQAQLETKKRYQHPFYWSAFQLTGMGQ